ncbi:MAG: 6-phosphogluconolactonase [Opitutales bacterium]
MASLAVPLQRNSTRKWQRNRTDPSPWRKLHWSVSDERCVPIEDMESNFGNADRGFLQRYGVVDAHRHPWPTMQSDDLPQAARNFEASWRSQFGSETCFDLCFLGMGDDCHTASLFPSSSLLLDEPNEWFAAVEVPGKGWRFSVTKAGLANSSQIVVTVTGQSKATALREALHGPYDPINKPVQNIREVARRTVWLVDPLAGNKLSGVR